MTQSAENDPRPLAEDGKPGCPVIVWDGPYRMRCSLGAAVGRCAYHGEFARFIPPGSGAGCGAAPEQRQERR